MCRIAKGETTIIMSVDDPMIPLTSAFTSCLRTFDAMASVHTLSARLKKRKTRGAKTFSRTNASKREAFVVVGTSEEKWKAVGS